MANKYEHTSQRIIVNAEADKEVATGKLLSRVGVSVCLSDYEFIDRVSRDTEGLSLMDLGIIDSRRAYKIAKLALYRLAETNLAATVVNGEVVADKNNATPEELAAASKSSIASRLPDEDTTEINFTVGVYPSVHDIYALKFDPESTIPLVEMHVTPPDLAA
jgi:hypothetical protein